MRIGSPYRPSSGRFAATFPQGKASLRRTARFYVVQLYTPSGCPKGQPPPPTRREAYATLFLRIEFERAGHAAAPTNEIEAAFRPSFVMGVAMTAPPTRREPNAPPGGFPPKNHKKTRPEYSQDGATRAKFKNAHRRGVKRSFQQRNIL